MPKSDSKPSSTKGGLTFLTAAAPAMPAQTPEIKLQKAANSLNPDNVKVLLEQNTFALSTLQEVLKRFQENVTESQRKENQRIEWLRKQIESNGEVYEDGRSNVTNFSKVPEITKLLETAIASLMLAEQPLSKCAP